MNEQMLLAFREHEAEYLRRLAEHSTVGTPPGTRLMRIIRIRDGWRLWLSTRDFVQGTYMDVMNNGLVMRTTIRADEGPEHFIVRPSDDEIMNK